MTFERPKRFIGMDKTQTIDRRARERIAGLDADEDRAMNTMINTAAAALYGVSCWLWVLQPTASAMTAAAQRAGPTTPFQHFDKLTLERTACEGTCPVYRVVVYGDGSVEYQGMRFVEVSGRARKTLSPAQVRQLVAAVNEAQYFSLRDSYRSKRDGCPTYAIDLPTAMTSVTVAGSTQRVRHDLGCRQLSGDAPDGPYPVQLAELEDRIDQIVGTAQWVGVAK